MSPEERDPQFLICNGYLEKCRDFDDDDKKVLASRLGYRITMRFVHSFFGRVFSHPHAVFTEKMLHPETQDYDIFADGMDNIVETQRRVAQAYFDDNSISEACPPLRALLHIMVHDQCEGKDLNHPDIRHLFTREYLLGSDWYAERLSAKQASESRLWQRHVHHLEQFLGKSSYADEARRLGITERLAQAKRHLTWVESYDFLKFLNGSLGLHPIKQGIAAEEHPKPRL
jgi:hypothetical protein